MQTIFPDSGISFSWQAWKSHTLEAKQFLLYWGLKTHSLLIPFLPQMKIAFPTFCVLRVSQCLKALAWRSFLSRSFPWDWDLRESPYTHRERKTNIQMSVPSWFLCRRGLVRLGLYGKFLEPVGTHPECEPGYRTFRNGKIPIFLFMDAKEGRFSNCLKIHPFAVFLLLTALALSSLWNFLRKWMDHNSLPWAPLQWMSTRPGDHGMSPSTFKLPQPSSSRAIMVWPRNVFTRLGKYRQTHYPGFES